LENSPSASSIGDSKTVVREFIADAEARFARKGQLSGITSGLSKFDRMTDGIQRGEMTIVAARPSIGKTAIGMCIVDAACIRGDVPTLVVTAEMYRSALMRRLIAVHARVPMQSLRTGDLSERDFKAMTDGGGRIGKAPLHFFDAVVDPSVDRVVAEIRRAVRKYGIQLVLVDYLQKLQASASHEKRTYEVAEVSGKLRACAVSTGVAMVVLAQLNRESEKEKGRAPRLSDLADSGQIERDADTVALLSRDRNVKHGDAMLLVAKQRDGETGGVPLLFEGEFCRFSDAPADTGE
jgi:replicative DNA helicase